MCMLLAFSGCGKSEYVKNAEALIDAIGEVTADSEDAVIAAEKAFDALTDEDKAKVSNADKLAPAREALDKALEEKAAAELEALRQSLLGKWVTQVEMKDTFAQVVDSILGYPGISFADYLDSFPVAMVMELTDSGTYFVYGDKDAMGDTIVALKSATSSFTEDLLLLVLIDTLTSYYPDATLNSWEDIEELLEMSKEEMIITRLGMPIDEYVEQNMGDNYLNEVIESMESEGRFSVEPGKLHTSSDINVEPKEGDYESFVLDGDTLTLTDYAGTSSMEGVVYPMVFQRG